MTGNYGLDHYCPEHQERWEECGCARPGSSGTTDGPSKFAGTIMRRSELAKIPPVEPLIDGVLSRRSTAVLVGQTGAGKTFVGLSWACSAGTGHPWLGRTVHHAPSLYIVGEGAHGLDARVAAWEQAWQTDVHDDEVVFSIRPASLSGRDTWTEIAAQSRDMGAGLIVLDTYSSLAWDMDETKDAPTVMRRLSDLAGETGATTLLIHHPGWGDTSRARGGSQIEANADEVLILHGNAQSPLVRLEMKKSKEGPSSGGMWLRRQPTAMSVVIEAVGAEEMRRETGRTSAQVIREAFDGQTVSRVDIRNQLTEGLGIQASAAYVHINGLLQTGVLVLDGGTKTRPMYRVVSDAE